STARFAHRPSLRSAAGRRSRTRSDIAERVLAAWNRQRRARDGEGRREQLVVVRHLGRELVAVLELRPEVSVLHARLDGARAVDDVFAAAVPGELPDVLDVFRSRTEPQLAVHAERRCQLDGTNG